MDFENPQIAPANAISASHLPRGIRSWLSRNIFWIAVLVFAAGFLSPLLSSGFYIDDMVNSCTAGFMLMEDFDLGSFIAAHTHDWMLHGRFFPLALVITYTAHVLFLSTLPYKLFTVALALIDLLAFHALLRAWRVPRAAAALGTLFLVLLFQTRRFSDPLLSFAGIMQLLAAQLLLALLTLEWYLDTGRRRWLVASVVLHVSSLMTYEISYLFLAIYLAATYARFQAWRPALLGLRAHLAVTLIMAAFVSGLRTHVPYFEKDAYRPNWDPMAIYSAARVQTVSALPLSYPLLSDYRWKELSLVRLISRWDNWLMALAAGGSGALVACGAETSWCTRSHADERRLG